MFVFLHSPATIRSWDLSLHYQNPSKQSVRNLPHPQPKKYRQSRILPTCTLPRTLYKRRKSGTYQKKTHWMCIIMAKTRRGSKICAAKPTTAMNCASIMDITNAPDDHIFQPFGSVADANTY